MILDRCIELLIAFENELRRNEKNEDGEDEEADMEVEMEIGTGTAQANANTEKNFDSTGAENERAEGRGGKNEKKNKNRLKAGDRILECRKEYSGKVSRLFYYFKCRSFFFYQPFYVSHFFYLRTFYFFLASIRCSVRSFFVISSTIFSDRLHGLCESLLRRNWTSPTGTYIHAYVHFFHAHVITSFFRFLSSFSYFKCIW